MTHSETVAALRAAIAGNDLRAYQALETAWLKQPGNGRTGWQRMLEMAQDRPPPEKVVVSRHPALVEYIREIGLADADTPVIEHAYSEDVCEKHVIGVVPLHLACEAAKITEIVLCIAPSDRGRELTLEEIRRYAVGIETYRVFDLEKYPYYDIIP
jgi:hypothetical protein